MKCHIVCSLIAALVISSSALAADKDAIQGTWTIESMIIGGREIAEIKGTPVVITDKAMIISIEGMKQSSDYKLDDSKKPKHMDVTSKGPGGVERPSKAIYKLEGDTLTICSAGAEVEEQKVEVKPGDPEPKKRPKTVIKVSDRPTTFDAKHGALMVLKRKK